MGYAKLILLFFFPLLSGLVAMLIAQGIKILSSLIYYRRINIASLSISGGMPSSHSAMVAALTLSIGIQEGFSSVAFAICFIFSLVVIYDAAGVRYAAGKQAVAINAILETLRDTGQLETSELKVTRGHTKREVSVGVLLGIAISFAMYFLIASTR